MKIRRARESDSKELWSWRNDPQTRKNSTNKDEISWEAHSDWYASSLDNKAREIFIGLDDKTDEPIGMVRFDGNDAKATSDVSINLNPDWRGKKVSTTLLASAIKEYQEGRAYILIANIHPHNTASIKCFEQCGFAQEEETAELLTFKNRQGIIDAIEGVRSANNVNWMDLMRLAFRRAPKEAGDIVRRINSDDGKIADLLKRLGD